MSSLKITIPWTPRPKGSVQLNGVAQRWYNPSQKGMLKTREHARNCLPSKDLPYLKGPLLVIVHFVLPAHKSQPKRWRKEQHNKPHISRPDGDNLEKYLNDALSSIFWHDDCTIAWILRSKSQTSELEGKTIIYAVEIPHEKPDYEFLLSEIKKHINLEDQHD
jgi:Holliday junction resolvase RusA-like endonuclease